MTAVCWSITPIIIRKGQAEFKEPLLGVTVGMIASMLTFAVVVALRRNEWTGVPVKRDLMNWQLLAGVLVGTSTWARWVALDLAPVGTVLALGRLNVPIVIILSVFMLDRKHERVTWNVWLGGAFILAGALLLTFFGKA